MSEAPNTKISGDLQFSAGVQTVLSKGSSPAFFSCWDMHSYYGESYIVQGLSFDIRQGEYWPC